ncbi:hypothetical protein [Candidatus Lokiarchaeum ossiferum]|uniref:hypothetical protein n=1 Tax=Candidatus Lokiarchaeum ossiferum TaxID=2951803 RepID=UPI00352C8D5C
MNKTRVFQCGLHPRNVCEYLGCTNTNAEVELVNGHPLSLCEHHGAEMSEDLTRIGLNDQENGLLLYLKKKSRQK